MYPKDSYPINHSECVQAGSTFKTIFIPMKSEGNMEE